MARRASAHIPALIRDDADGEPGKRTFAVLISGRNDDEIDFFDVGNDFHVEYLIGGYCVVRHTSFLVDHKRAANGPQNGQAKTRIRIWEKIRLVFSYNIRICIVPTYNTWNGTRIEASRMTLLLRTFHEKWQNNIKQASKT